MSAATIDRKLACERAKMAPRGRSHTKPGTLLKSQIPIRTWAQWDGAHVEQKNWARVRELVGYLRYDTSAELEKLNQIWELDLVFTNYLLAQQKLIFKQRHGAKVTKKYDAGSTPHQRAIGHESMQKWAILGMNAEFKGIKPLPLGYWLCAYKEIFAWKF